MSSGFVTESEVLELRKKRQEEWERVRTAADPIERPEEPFDSRSLYDKLKEQKQKKDLEYEEAHKLKNMIKGLDDDEIDFLDLVDRSKLAADRKKNIEEEKELNDYRNRVEKLKEAEMDQKIHSNVCGNKKKGFQGNNSQLKLLKGAIVTKTKAIKHKLEDSKDENIVADKITCVNNVTASEKVSGSVLNPNLKCIGILPGLGHYQGSSSEETSDSDSDNEVPRPKLDLLGRRIEEKQVES